MDIEGLATYDALDALADRQRHAGGGGAGDGGDGGGGRGGGGGGDGMVVGGSGSGSFRSLSTRNGNFTKLPFKVHAVNGMDEFSIERGSLFNDSIAYFPRGALLLILLKGTTRSPADGIGAASISNHPGTRIVETSRTRKHTTTTIYLQHPYAGRNTAELDTVDADGTTTATALAVYRIHLGPGLQFESVGDEHDFEDAKFMDEASFNRPVVHGAINMVGSPDDRSNLVISTVVERRLRPAIVFRDGLLQFLSKHGNELSTPFGPLSLRARGGIDAQTRSDIALRAGVGPRDTEMPVGAVIISANDVAKGLRLRTELSSFGGTAPISLRTGDTTSPGSTSGSVFVMAGVASGGGASHGGSIVLQGGNVTGSDGWGGSVRIRAGSSPGDFSDMNGNHAFGGHVHVSSGNGFTESGDISVASGSSQHRTGRLQLRTGSPSVRGESGDVHIQTGDAEIVGGITLEAGKSQFGDGGNVTIRGGQSEGSPKTSTGSSTTTTNSNSNDKNRGGAIHLVTGACIQGRSGILQLRTGSVRGGNPSGDVSLSTGLGERLSGDVRVQTGNAALAGNLILQPGASLSAPQSAASVFIRSGDNEGDGDGGDMFLTSGTSASTAQNARSGAIHIHSGPGLTAGSSSGNVSVETGAANATKMVTGSVRVSSGHNAMSATGDVELSTGHAGYRDGDGAGNDAPSSSTLGSLQSGALRISTGHAGSAGPILLAAGLSTHRGQKGARVAIVAGQGGGDGGDLVLNSGPSAHAKAKDAAAPYASGNIRIATHETMAGEDASEQTGGRNAASDDTKTTTGAVFVATGKTDLGSSGVIHVTSGQALRQAGGIHIAAGRSMLSSSGANVLVSAGDVGTEPGEISGRENRKSTGIGSADSAYLSHQQPGNVTISSGILRHRSSSNKWIVGGAVKIEAGGILGRLSSSLSLQAESLDRLRESVLEMSGQLTNIRSSALLLQAHRPTRIPDPSQNMSRKLPPKGSLMLQAGETDMGPRILLASEGHDTGLQFLGGSCSLSSERTKTRNSSCGNVHVSSASGSTLRLWGNVATQDDAEKQGSVSLFTGQGGKLHLKTADLRAPLPENAHHVRHAHSGQLLFASGSVLASEKHGGESVMPSSGNVTIYTGTAPRKTGSIMIRTGVPFSLTPRTGDKTSESNKAAAAAKEAGIISLQSGEGGSLRISNQIRLDATGNLTAMSAASVRIVAAKSGSVTMGTLVSETENTPAYRNVIALAPEKIILSAGGNSSISIMTKDAIPITTSDGGTTLPKTIYREISGGVAVRTGNGVNSGEVTIGTGNTIGGRAGSIHLSVGVMRSQAKTSAGDSTGGSIVVQAGHIQQDAFVNEKDQVLSIGGRIEMRAGDAVSAGGNITLSSGSSKHGPSGNISIYSAHAKSHPLARSGALSFYTGNASAGGSGNLTIETGQSRKDAGIILIHAGDSESKRGGAIRLVSGSSYAESHSRGGDIELLTGAGGKGKPSGAVRVASGGGGAVDASGGVYLTSGSANQESGDLELRTGRRSNSAGSATDKRGEENADVAIMRAGKITIQPGESQNSAGAALELVAGNVLSTVDTNDGASFQGGGVTIMSGNSTLGDSGPLRLQSASVALVAGAQKSSGHIILESGHLVDGPGELFLPRTPEQNENTRGSGSVRIATGSFRRVTTPRLDGDLKKRTETKYANSAGTLTLAGGDAFGDNLKAGDVLILGGAAHISSGPSKAMQPTVSSSSSSDVQKSFSGAGSITLRAGNCSAGISKTPDLCGAGQSGNITMSSGFGGRVAIVDPGYGGAERIAVNSTATVVHGNDTLLLQAARSVLIVADGKGPFPGSTIRFDGSTLQQNSGSILLNTSHGCTSIEGMHALQVQLRAYDPKNSKRGVGARRDTKSHQTNPRVALNVSGGDLMVFASSRVKFGDKAHIGLVESHRETIDNKNKETLASTILDHYLTLQVHTDLFTSSTSKPAWRRKKNGQTEKFLGGKIQLGADGSFAVGASACAYQARNKTIISTDKTAAGSSTLHVHHGSAEELTVTPETSMGFAESGIAGGAAALISGIDPVLQLVSAGDGSKGSHAASVVLTSAAVKKKEGHAVNTVANATHWSMAMTGRRTAAAGVAPSGSLVFSFATSSNDAPLNVQVKRSPRIDPPALIVTPTHRVGIGVKKPSDTALLTVAGNVLAYDVTVHAASIIEVNKTSGRETPKVLDKLRKLRVITGSLKGDQFDDRQRYLFSRRELQMYFPDIFITHQGLDKVSRGKQYGFQLAQLSAVLTAAVGEAADRIQDVNATLAKHVRTTSQWMKRTANSRRGTVRAAASAASAAVASLGEEEDSSRVCAKAEDFALLKNRVAVLEKTHAALLSELESAVKNAQQTAQSAMTQSLQAKKDAQNAMEKAKNAAPHSKTAASTAASTAVSTAAEPTTTNQQLVAQNAAAEREAEAAAVKPVPPTKTSVSDFDRAWFVAKKNMLKTLLEDGILSQDEFAGAVSAALEKFSTSH
jgi:hypothetical protein